MRAEDVEKRRSGEQQTRRAENPKEKETKGKEKEKERDKKGEEPPNQKENHRKSEA